jgi:peptidoglycan/xylan/chitin deacetylase (PgdA/CDA1 family)
MTMNPLLLLYYLAKPLIPRTLQIWGRRRLAHMVLSRSGVSWPIHDRSGMKPAFWKGWPKAKDFALVLVHDVETRVGYERCEMLLQIERDLGFVSCFNFVPKRYKVKPEMIQYIRDGGCEVGLHGLKHDGMLFLSKRVFQRNAVKINRFLDAWQAVGFYSPSMLFDRDKIKLLNILYDQSTFDIDPFEPSPVGVHTIFPFYVPDESPGKGYVELPYTLAQDHTLFIILQEKGIDRWKEKLDWIARMGGMALLKVHPDYMDFGILQNAKRFEYPASYYIEFLHHIRNNYEGRYWHALPKQVAEFYMQGMFQG